MNQALKVYIKHSIKLFTATILSTVLIYFSILLINSHQSKQVIASRAMGKIPFIDWWGISLFYIAIPYFLVELITYFITRKEVKSIAIFPMASFIFWFIFNQIVGFGIEWHITYTYGVLISILIITTLIPLITKAIKGILHD
jgi:hypothetical protein